MKKNLFYLLALATLGLTASCEKEDNTIPTPKSVGISFAEATDTVDLNTTTNTAAVEITVEADMTKAELEKRLKLSYTSTDAEQDKHYRIKSTTVTENPLKISLELEALPSVARTPQTIAITFDDTMQPITIGQNSTYTLTILPYSPVRTWHKDAAYYAPFVYHHTSTGTWQNVAAHFSSVPGDDAAVLGFVNNFVENSGTTFFNFHRIYATQIAGTVGGSVTAANAKINVPKALEFIPSAAGSKTGTVNVIAQNVTVSRKDGSTFTLGISGQGTYDENAKLIDLVLDVNETNIGGPAKASYTYKISAEKLTF